MSRRHFVRHFPSLIFPFARRFAMPDAAFFFAISPSFFSFIHAVISLIFRRLRRRYFAIISPVLGHECITVA